MQSLKESTNTPIIDFIWLLPESGDGNRHLRSIISEEAMHCANSRFRFYSASRYQKILAARGEVVDRDDRPQAVVLFGSVLRPSCDLFSLLHSVRRQFACPTALWATDDPYEFDVNSSFASIVDLVFTNDRNTADYYTQARAVPLPLAASENLAAAAEPLRAEEDAEWDFIFCGIAFDNRIQIIEGLKPVLKRYRTLIVGNLTHGTPVWPAAQLGGISFQEPLPYTAVVDLYKKSRVVLNLSRSYSICNRLYEIVPSTPAPRTYEVAALGVAQAAFYDRPEIFQDFAEDEIAVFSSLTEFADLAEIMLSKPAKRLQMARRARERVLAQHLYRHRLTTLASHLLYDVK